MANSTWSTPPSCIDVDPILIIMSAHLYYFNRIISWLKGRGWSSLGGNPSDQQGPPRLSWQHIQFVKAMHLHGSVFQQLL